MVYQCYKGKKHNITSIGEKAMSQKPVLTLWNEETINESDARILRTACADIPVPIDNNGIRDVDTLMEAFLVREDALGLAAPQIGIGKRIIVFRNKGFDCVGRLHLLDNALQLFGLRFH